LNYCTFVGQYEWLEWLNVIWFFKIKQSSN
jgi:hypothetical protein